jgi:N-acetylmuramoyl-L-alanine amidase
MRKISLPSLDFSSHLRSSWYWGLRHWKLLIASSIVLVVAIVGLISYVNSIEPQGIIIHHTGPVSADGYPIEVEFLDQFHHQRGYGSFYWGHVYHVGYHYVILPDGTVQQGRPEHLQGAHARGYNTYLGIALVGNFSSKRQSKIAGVLSEPTPAQMQSLISLCKNLSRQYQIPAGRVLRHSDVAQTECPGGRFPYRDVVAAIYAPPVVAQRSVR